MDGNNIGGVAGERLRSYIERIERLEEEKKSIADDIKDVKSEAKSAGFNTKAINQILRLRKMDLGERHEFEEVVDIYKHALGMAPFGDTPLGRANPKPEQPPEDTKPEDESAQDKKPASKKSTPKAPPQPVTKKPDYPEDATEQDARDLGTQAAKDGKPVTANPFPAKDSRRAAWDEAWCKETGSDGMEIPKNLRRKRRGAAEPRQGNKKEQPKGDPPDNAKKPGDEPKKDPKGKPKK